MSADVYFSIESQLSANPFYSYITPYIPRPKLDNRPLDLSIVLPNPRRSNLALSFARVHPVMVRILQLPFDLIRLGGNGIRDILDLPMPE